MLVFSGLSLLADTYEDDAHRSKVMGIALGGMAVGVLSTSMKQICMTSCF